MEVKPVILKGKHISGIHLLTHSTNIILCVNCLPDAERQEDTDKQDMVFALRECRIF